MKIEAYNDIEAFATLKDEWNSIKTAKPQLFLTWQWQSTWWEVYQPGELWLLTIRDAANQLVGIAPWFIDDAQQIHTIGCEDVTDYLDMIVQAGCEAEVLHTVACYLRDHAAKFKGLALCNIPSASPTLHHFPSMLREQGFTVTLTTQDVCPIITLGDSWDAYLETLDKKQRHEIRRKLRRAEEEAITWYIVGADHNLDEQLDIFLQLMERASLDKAEFLQNPQHVQFFRRIAHLFAEQGWLQLAILCYEDQPAAAYLNFDYNHEILVYNSGLDLSVGGAYSPGIVLGCHLMQHAIARGYTVFDMLRGNEEYKYRMGAKDTEIIKLTAELAK